MPANPAFIGRTLASPSRYEVTSGALVAFANAVGASHPACRDVGAARALGYSGIVAAPTFAVVIAQAAEAAYVGDPESGIDFSRVVHASERFVHHRPIVAGDVLVSTLHVEDITSRTGLTFVTTRVEIADDGGPVATVTSTLAIREGE